MLRRAALVVALLSSPVFAQENTTGSETSSESAAETPLRVVLVTNHADARIVPLLKAELESLGFEVVEVDHGENEVVPRDLGRAARQTNSLAGFRVIVAEKSVEVWIADRVTGKVVLREALEQDSASKGSESVVVLRAVELLRVSLMEVEAPHEPRGEVEPPAELVKMVGFPEHRGRHAVEFGAIVSWVSPDLPIVPGIQLAYAQKLGSWFHFSVQGSSDLSAPEVETEEGAARVKLARIGAFAGLNREDSTARLQPILRLGPGLLWTRIVGDSAGELEEYSHNVFSPTLDLEARLLLRSSNALRFWAGGGASVVFGRPAVQIDGVRVIEFSPVSVRGAAGIQVAWP